MVIKIGEIINILEDCFNYAENFQSNSGPRNPYASIQLLHHHRLCWGRLRLRPTPWQEGTRRAATCPTRKPRWKTAHGERELPQQESHGGRPRMSAATTWKRAPGQRQFSHKHMESATSKGQSHNRLCLNCLCGGG